MWYKFWRRCGLTQSLTKNYFELNEIWYPTEEMVKSLCESWANVIDEDYNQCQHGFKKIEKPPKEWLKKQIKYHEELVKRTDILIKHYKEILDTYKK